MSSWITTSRPDDSDNKQADAGDASGFTGDVVIDGNQT